MEERRKELPFRIWLTRYPDVNGTVQAVDAVSAREKGAALWRVARWDVSAKHDDPRSVAQHPWVDPPWWAPNPAHRKNGDNATQARLAEVEALYADVVRRAEEIRVKHPDPEVMWEERVDIQREKDRLWSERWDIRRKLGLDPRTGLKPTRAPRGGRDAGASGHYPDLLEETQDVVRRGSRIVRHPAPSGILHASCDDESFHHLRYALPSGKVVAGLTLRAGRSWRGEQSAVIDRVFTDASHRRSGYATALIRYARSIFRSVRHSKDLTDEGRAWKRSVRNGDERLRDLERAADAGDRTAFLALLRGLERTGFPVPSDRSAVEFFYDNDLSDPLPGTGRSTHAIALAEAERTMTERGWQVNLSKDDYYNSYRERTELMKGMTRNEIAIEVMLIDPTPTGPGDGGSILDSVTPIFIDMYGPFDEEPDDLSEYPPDVRVAAAYMALKALRADPAPGTGTEST